MLRRSFTCSGTTSSAPATLRQGSQLLGESACWQQPAGASNGFGFLPCRSPAPAGLSSYSFCCREANCWCRSGKVLPSRLRLQLISRKQSALARRKREQQEWSCREVLAPGLRHTQAVGLRWLLRNVNMWLWKPQQALQKPCCCPGLRSVGQGPARRTCWRDQSFQEVRQVTILHQTAGSVGRHTGRSSKAITKSNHQQSRCLNAHVPFWLLSAGSATLRSQTFGRQVTCPALSEAASRAVQSQRGDMLLEDIDETHSYTEGINFIPYGVASTQPYGGVMRLSAVQVTTHGVPCR